MKMGWPCSNACGASGRASTVGHTATMLTNMGGKSKLMESDATAGETDVY